MSVSFGKTYSIGNNHNILWTIGNDRGKSFEENVYKYIKLLCIGNPNVQIDQTPVVNDGGKDIVLKFKGDSLSLFGITFKNHGNEETTIYIECKSTDQNKLRREKFYPTIDNVIHADSKIDYFVLLTNSVILAKDHYHVKKDLEKIGAKFVLIDQYIIARQLTFIPYSFFTNFECYSGQDHFYLEYQVYQIDSYEDSLEIYFVFRNYSTESKTYTLSLLTNLNWITDNNEYLVTVEPYDSAVLQLKLKRENKSDYQNINFSVIDNGITYSIVITDTRLSVKYIPSFIGEQHKQVIDIIYSNLQNKKFKNLFCLWGDAGVGKTRITEELVNKIKNKLLIDIFICTLKINNNLTIKEIYSFLRENKYLKQDATNDLTNFKETILSCQNDVSVALIVIDDFHNSSKYFMEQIKELKNHSAPVVIILCGRTDYSAGNTDYYNFVEWSSQNLTKDKSVWNIKPLNPDDTKRFIHCSIQGVPDAVYESIFINSQNNPLYIVQYVEHLLDEKIAYLENENTVSIYSTYKVKLINSLPKKINDIYEKRILFIQNEGQVKKIDYFLFLLIMTMYNGQISEFDAREFDPDSLKISFLMKKRFIRKCGRNYLFIHESIKIFLAEKLMNNSTLQKKLGKEMLAHKAKVSGYSKYILARLYYWTKQYDLAMKEYEPIINAVSRENNFSNKSIDTSIYDYIDDILDIIKNEEKYKDIAKKLINTKIYITLHHLIPINAVRDCNKCLEYILRVPFLKDDRKLINSICAQKAHSLLNSGMNYEGILMLNELQVKMMMDKSEFDYQSIFDIADRLCAVYIKFNCYDISHEYNNLEIKIAMENHDYSLLAIAYRTRSKLYYLRDYDECMNSLSQVDNCLQKSPSNRIELNNSIYRNIVELSYNIGTYDNSIIKTEKMVQKARNSNLNRAYIQGHLLLSALYLKRGRPNDLLTAEAKANIALNYSIRFGISSYLWQIHNITAIINSRLGKNKEEIKKQFNSAFNILRAQNMLFIGKKNLCYSNILAISNIAFFIRHQYTQDYFNSKMSVISYFNEDDSNQKSITMPKQILLEKENLDYLYKITSSSRPELLFCDDPKVPLLKDEKTGYFIALT